jgi:hypothetical protein
MGNRAGFSVISGTFAPLREIVSITAMSSAWVLRNILF